RRGRRARARRPAGPQQRTISRRAAERAGGREMTGSLTRPRLVSSMALLVLLATGGAGCLSLHRGGAPAATASLGPGYAGSAACARCHPQEAAEHRLSGHWGTLQRVDSPLGTTLKPSAWLR